MHGSGRFFRQFQCIAWIYLRILSSALLQLCDGYAAVSLAVGTEAERAHALVGFQVLLHRFAQTGCVIEL